MAQLPMPLIWAHIDRDAVSRFTDKVYRMDTAKEAFNFYSFKGEDGNEIVDSNSYPPLNAPGAINFFFAVCLHEFGFWYGNDAGYQEPMFGVMGGKPRKGSDWLWRASMKIYWSKGYEFFAPKNLARISLADFKAWFADDNGPMVLPDFETRYRLTRAYGQFFAEKDPNLWLLPAAIVSRSNDARDPLELFLDQVWQIPGFDKDKLQKRQLLLAMILANRPERFLRPAPDTKWPPIVDYHLMRLALRLGLVKLEEPVRSMVAGRQWLTPGQENTIRNLVCQAVWEVIRDSGKPMSEVDALMWSAREYCPEMKEPDCAACPLADVCEKHATLFQPVLRTTAY